MRVVGWRLWSIVLLCWLLLLWRVVLLLLLQLTPRGRVLLLLVFGRRAAEGAESGEVVLDQRPGGGPQLGLVPRHAVLRLVELLVQLLLLLQLLLMQLVVLLIQLLLLQLVVLLAPQHVLLHLVRDVL